MKMIDQTPYTTEYWNQAIQDDFLQQTLGIVIDDNVYWIEIDQVEEEREHQVEGLSIITKLMMYDHNITLLDFTVRNELSTSKEIKLLVAHRDPRENELHISFISPIEHLIYHMIDRRMYLVNGHLNGLKMKENTIMQQADVDNNTIWSQGKKGKRTLKYNPIGKGKAISLCGDAVSLRGKCSIEGQAWAITDHCQKELLQVNQTLLKNILAFQTKK